MTDDYYVNVQNPLTLVFVVRIYFHVQEYLNDENEVVNLLVKFLVVDDYSMLMIEKWEMIEKQANEIDDD